MVWYNLPMPPEHDFALPQSPPLLIVISGPSGAGKDSVLQRMKESGLPFHFVVTATTRPPREGEVHGRDYLFVSEEEFLHMVEAGELLEHALVYGQYKGIPKQQVRAALASGKEVVMRLDVQGAETIRQLAPEALLIFVTAESEEELIHRLAIRKTENEEEFRLRVATAREEFQRIEAFDYLIINRDECLGKTMDTLRAILEAEHHRVKPRKVEL